LIASLPLERNQSVGDQRVGELVAHPWPHLIIDDFLPGPVLAQALAEINADTYHFDIEQRGTGRIEYSLLKSETMWRAIYSRRMVSMLASAFAVKVKLNKHNMLQLRRMNDDTPEFPLHHDFTSNHDAIASFLYLSSGWSSKCGGRLHLYESGTDSAPSASVDPLKNRFVAFQTKPSHWHSVERVYGWERISVLSLWNVDTPPAS
jgi:hypothetical protein